MTDRVTTPSQPGHLPAVPKQCEAGDRAASLAADAEVGELAQAAGQTGSAWAWLPASHAAIQLGRRVARSLVEAGLSLHHCDEHDPLYRLGGVCVLPATAKPGEHPAGVTVSWTAHHLLALDESRWGTYTVIVRAMNNVLGTVLATLGYDAEPFGMGGAWIINMGAGEDREAHSR